MYIVYILQSEKNGRYYTGMTSDLDQRIRYHNLGKNISTRIGRPWKLVYREQFEDKKNAWLREQQIKLHKGGSAFKKLLK